MSRAIFLASSVDSVSSALSKMRSRNLRISVSPVPERRLIKTTSSKAIAHLLQFSGNAIKSPKIKGLQIIIRKIKRDILKC